MTKAVVYARYSSDSQTEQSIEGQVRVCNEYAEKNGIKILEYYVDRAMTGTNDNRPDFKRMLEDSKKKLWDCILVYRFDRFSRNKYESVIHKKNLKDLGISVVSAMENIPNTPEGIILESLLEGLNQYYSAELSQKVKRGLRESRIKGNYHGGPRPYGYHVIDKKLVIDEKEAKIVRYIFKQYLLGHYGTGIAKKLNRKGLRYMTGKPFNSDHVCSIINKEYYTGMYFHDGEYFHNIYPPIVERNIFRKALERKSLFCCRQYFREAFAFRNKIVCKQCGARFRIDGTEKKYVYKYYKCTTRKKDKTACSASQYRKTYLEDYLI